MCSFIITYVYFCKSHLNCEPLFAIKMTLEKTKRVSLQFSASPLGATAALSDPHVTYSIQSASGLSVSQKSKMAALGRLSQALLRSSLTQSRRQLSASAHKHGEQSGNRIASLCVMNCV